jgi:hypothetical protein
MYYLRGSSDHSLRSEVGDIVELHGNGHEEELRGYHFDE